MLILEIAAGIVLGVLALASIELWLPLVFWLFVAGVGLAAMAAVVVGIKMAADEGNWPAVLVIPTVVVGLLYAFAKWIDRLEGVDQQPDSAGKEVGPSAPRDISWGKHEPGRAHQRKMADVRAREAWA
jgi:hypothetical protein